MSEPITLLAAGLFGWCGTVPPVLFPPLVIEMPPKRRLCKICTNFAGAVAGVAMASVANLQFSDAGFVRFAVTAYVAGIVGVSLYEVVTGAFRRES